METAKMGVFFLVAILAFGGVGISYATWTESVDMDVTATTGKLDFKISAITINEEDGATINVHKVDAYEWQVTVSNTYPGWKGYLTVTHKNAGTVPLKFDSFQVVDWTGEHALRTGYTIKFYAPDGTPNIYTDNTANVWGSLYDFRVKQYYEGSGVNHWGIDPAYVTLQPNDTHDSLISMELIESLTGYEEESVTFTFRMWATQA